MEVGGGGAQEGGGGERRANTVSFVLMVAGLCQHQTFKPGKDESQWWGRRDALVRSVAAALWRQEGTAWAAVRECALVFDDASVLRLSPPLVTAVTLPTERRLITALRDALLQPRAVAGVRVRFAAPPARAAGTGEAGAGGDREGGPGRDRAHKQQKRKRAEEGGGGGGDMEQAYERILSAKSSVNLVCLLHEDFPCELPVFGQRQPPGVPGGGAGQGGGHGGSVWGGGGWCACVARVGDGS